MKRTKIVCALLALLVLGTIPGSEPARAQDGPITLRIATLTPRGSAWHRVFTAWGNSLSRQTAGALTLQVQPAGPGDEMRLVTQFRAHEIDGASFTAIGIGQIAQSVLVLQAPGVCDGYTELDRARTALDSDLRAQFTSHGAELMGWSDYGQGRIFSTRPIAQPSDFRGAHTWTMPNDPMFPVFLQIVGGTGVPLPIGGVMAALNAGTVDTVVASATAVSALQWHTRLTHVTEQSNAVLIGATLIDRDRFQALPEALRDALRTTSAQAHATLQTTIRRDDDRFFQGLTTRGLQTVDARPHDAEWRAAAAQARDRLVGQLYTRAELDRAIAAARHP